MALSHSELRALVNGWRTKSMSGKAGGYAGCAYALEQLIEANERSVSSSAEREIDVRREGREVSDEVTITGRRKSEPALQNIGPGETPVSREIKRKIVCSCIWNDGQDPRCAIHGGPANE
jgi:hypothetical protein